MIAAVFSIPGLTPFPERVCPKYWIFVAPKTHFARLIFRVNFAILPITISTCFRCSSRSLLKIRQSSINVMQNSPRPFMMMSMALLKEAGLPVRP